MLTPPIEPMLAKLTEEVPPDGDFLFEPKWDGFRAIVFRDRDGVFIQSRELRPLDRYFPELHAVLLEQLPGGVVVDGEIVMPTSHGLDFGGLQMRLHPAASRVEKLAKAMPTAFVAFDLLAVDGKSLLSEPQAERRAKLETLFKKIRKPLYLTPMTRDRAVAVDWLKRFEGAGLDGVVAKPATAPYQPGKRAMFKQLVKGLAPLRKDASHRHPWRKWAEIEADSGRMPGGQSRWSAGKDLSWEPLRVERVCEVKYDHMEGER